jgi:hypothetical protein
MLDPIPLRTYLHSHFALDPSDEHLNYWETLHLHWKYECLRYAITLTWAPHTPNEEKLSTRLERFE